jgi:aryl-alcohol dehydrogenase-like predicted oxidoreductase
MISGLWQLAHGDKVDLDAAARAMEPLIDSGFDCFDMADHYSDAGKARAK